MSQFIKNINIYIAIVVRKHSLYDFNTLEFIGTFFIPRHIWSAFANVPCSLEGMCFLLLLVILLFL